MLGSILLRHLLALSCLVSKLIYLMACYHGNQLQRHYNVTQAVRQCSASDLQAALRCRLFEVFPCSIQIPFQPYWGPFEVLFVQRPFLLPSHHSPLFRSHHVITSWLPLVYFNALHSAKCFSQSWFAIRWEWTVLYCFKYFVEVHLSFLINSQLQGSGKSAMWLGSSFFS